MRVENLGKNVLEYCRQTGNGSSTHDLCPDCANQLEDDPNCFNSILKPYNSGEPEGDRGWGGDCAHPDYADDDYKCEICKVPLRSDD